MIWVKVFLTKDQNLCLENIMKVYGIQVSVLSIKNFTMDQEFHTTKSDKPHLEFQLNP